MSNSSFISIIFATYKRPDLLRQTLESFMQLNRAGLDCEIIAVDNCPQQTAKQLVGSYQTLLPIQYLFTAVPGKSSAINLGLAHAKGELLVFTDDDIIADPAWLHELAAAAKRHPEVDIFGGRILPKYPDNYQLLDKRIDFDNEFVKVAYGEADWQQPEGLIAAERIWGANMMVRKKVFTQELRFNPDIGPNGENYAMGSETEFLLRAYAACHAGIYVPSALVHHQVRKEQLSLEWLAGRAERLARGRIQMKYLRSQNTISAVPRYLYRKFLVRKLQLLAKFFYSKKKNFLHVIELNKIAGEIAQYRKIRHSANQAEKAP